MKRDLTLNAKVNDWTVVTAPQQKNGKNYITLECACGKQQEFQERYVNRSTFSQSCRACSQKRRRDRDGRTYNIGDILMNLEILKIHSGKTISYEVKCTKCGNIYHTGHSTLNKKANGKGLASCHNCFDTKDKTRKRFRMMTKHISLSKYKVIERQADLRGIEFNVDQNDLEAVFTGKCALSNIDIVIGTMSVTDDKQELGTASLDRIDSNKGYIKGNIQWLHKTVNCMKNNLPENVFLNFCNKINTHANQQPSLESNFFEGSETR